MGGGKFNGLGLGPLDLEETYGEKWKYVPLLDLLTNVYIFIEEFHLLTLAYGNMNHWEILIKTLFKVL